MLTQHILTKMDDAFRRLTSVPGLCLEGEPRTRRGYTQSYRAMELTAKQSHLA